jgi:hypothetical protein
MKFIYQEKPIVVDILEDDTIETIRYALSILLESDVYLFSGLANMRNDAAIGV